MINEKSMTLATDYHPAIDSAGWLVSEKMEDVRAYWDGVQFWTRGGNVIAAPAWFTRGLPAKPLDGGIWAGRGRFEEARQAVQLGRWTRRCRFVAFDAPETHGTWQRRLVVAAQLWRDVVSFEVCKGHDWLMDRLREVQTGGGEGLVIRHPAIHCYEKGRTQNVLKVKFTFPS